MELRDKFPVLYSNYFRKKSSCCKSPSPSMSYKIITKSHLIKTQEKHANLADYLLSYQKTFEERFEKCAERVNEEKYKECTFKPKINKKSRILDSSPSALKLKNSNSYKTLKDRKSPTLRTEALYEFAEVSRNHKKVMAT